MKFVKIIKNQWIKIFGIFFFFLLLGAYADIFAIGAPYAPGATLNPACPPGEVNCTVDITSYPAGLDTGIQFNNAGLFGSDSLFTYDSGVLKTPSVLISGIASSTIDPPTDLQYIINYTGSGLYSGTTVYLDQTDPTLLPPVNLQATQNSTTCINCNFTASNQFEHNWRVYSYIDTPGGRLYSPTYTTLPTDWLDDDSGDNYSIDLSWDPAVGADGYIVFQYYWDDVWRQTWDVSEDVGSATTAIDDNCGDYFCNRTIYKNNYHIYSYKDTSEGRIYSSSYLTSPVDITNDETHVGTDFTIDVSFTPATGVDGYRVIKYNPDWGYLYETPANDPNGTYIYGNDITSASFTDDGCGSVCYDSNNNSVVSSSIKYLNFGTTSGTTGYGLRDNIGVMEYKNDSGVWSGFGNVSGGLGGEILYQSGVDTTAKLANGISGQVLTSNGGTSAPSWTTVASSPITIVNSTNLFSTGLTGTGSGVTSSTDSIFLGPYAGYQSSSSASSNIFMGMNAGRSTNAQASIFLGPQAGQNTSSANFSNFFGEQSGYNASSVFYSNFFGSNTGNNADGAYNSNFFGQGAGREATSSSDSNFLGTGAGSYASSAYYSNFFGISAGSNADNSYSSNFFGELTGNNANNAYYSNFFGKNAGNNAVGAHNSNFFGTSAGQDVTSSSNSNFFGNSAGYRATNVTYSNFFGLQAGMDSSASNSNFFGTNAGNNADMASYSNFFGSSAGENATGANGSNFFGDSAGYFATNTIQSNFFGGAAGYNANNASYSNFFGNNAGRLADNASYSNLFGYQVGKFFTDNNIGSNNIIIGTNISLPNTFANRINIGGVLFGTGTQSDSSGDPKIIPTAGGMIGIGVVTPLNIFHVTGAPATGIPTARIENILNGTTQNDGLLILAGNDTGVATSQMITFRRPDNTIIGSITQTGAAAVGYNSGSDRRIKENIEPTIYGLSDLLKIKVEDFNFISDSNKKKTTGFIAQDLNEIFPSAVTTNGDNGTDTLSLNKIPWMIDYGRLTPLLVKAIQDMNLKVEEINNFETDENGNEIVNTWRDSITAWFANTTNGITEFIGGILRAKDKLCIGEGSEEVCITKEDLLQMKNNASILTVITTPEPALEETPVVTIPTSEEESAIETPVVVSEPVVEVPVVETPIVEIPVVEEPITEAPAEIPTL